MCREHDVKSAPPMTYLEGTHFHSQNQCKMTKYFSFCSIAVTVVSLRLWPWSALLSEGGVASDAAPDEGRTAGWFFVLPFTLPTPAVTQKDNREEGGGGAL